MGKRACFVIGPESSGTRMLTKALIGAGAWGDASHLQRLDTLEFGDRPDTIVFRRSVPHDDRWPPIKGLIRKMEFAGYRVRPIVILRDEHFTALSQVRVLHSPDVETALVRIEQAKAQIANALWDRDALFIKYEDFVERPQLRAEFFAELGLEEPDMQFFNANRKYQEERELEYALP